MKSNEKIECRCERCFKKISLEEYELNDFRYTYRVLSVEILHIFII